MVASTPRITQADVTVALADNADALALPAWAALEGAALAREGDDLIVHAPTGETLRIQGYFDGVPPALVLGDGARLGAVTVAALIDAGGLASARVVALRGPAYMDLGDGHLGELDIDRLLAGDATLELEEGGVLGLVLPEDGVASVAGPARLQLAWDAEARETHIRFDWGRLVVATADDPERAVVIETELGTIRHQGGQVGLNFTADGGLTITTMAPVIGDFGTTYLTTPYGDAWLTDGHRRITLPVDGPPSAEAEVTTDQIVALFQDNLLHVPMTEDHANDYGLQAAMGGDEPAAGALDVFEGPVAVLAEPLPESELATARPPFDYSAPSAIVYPEAPPDYGEERREPLAITRPEEIGVEPANEPPIAYGADVESPEDTVAAGQLSATDFDRDVLTFQLADDGAPAHGTVLISADGIYSYTPDADYYGTDTFTYEVSDGRGGVATATVNLDITPVPDIPVISVASVAGDEDVALPLQITVDVPGNEDVASVLLTGLPKGTTLNFGTKQGADGWLLQGDDLDHLADLVLTPSADSSADFTVHLSSTSTDGGAASADFDVVLDPVAGTPSLVVHDVTLGPATDDTIGGTGQADLLVGGGGADIISAAGGDDVIYGDSMAGDIPVTLPIDVSAALTDFSDNENLTLRISDVPADAELSLGTRVDETTWELSGDDLDPKTLDDLQLTLPPGGGEDVTLGVTAIAEDLDLDTGLSDIATVTQPLEISFGSGDDGADQILGGGGDDQIYGGGGDDDIGGDQGSDQIWGGAGDDTLSGGRGEDQIFGGAGDDTILGGADNDQLSGGEGHDTFVFAKSDGDDVIGDFSVGDSLRFEGSNKFDIDTLNIDFDEASGDTVITFDGLHNLSVTLEEVDLPSESYSVTVEPDALVVTFDEDK